MERGGNDDANDGGAGVTTRIALLGGTGDIGEGLALRWAFHTDEEIIVGSRDEERARSKAAEYEDEIAERGVDRPVAGATNAEAAERGDVVVLAVPPEYAVSTVEDVEQELGEAILVTPAVAMERDGSGFHYDPPSAGSVAAAVAEAAPDGTPVVGAFHNLPAAQLSNLDVDLALDTAVVGDDDDAKATVRGLAEEIDGLDTVDAGGIANAPEVESVTPLLINIAMNTDGMHHVGVRFT